MVVRAVVLSTTVLVRASPARTLVVCEVLIFVGDSLGVHGESGSSASAKLGIMVPRAPPALEATLPRIRVIEVRGSSVPSFILAPLVQTVDSLSVPDLLRFKTRGDFHFTRVADLLPGGRLPRRSAFTVQRP